MTDETNRGESEEEREINQLSDAYSVLKNDARSIIADLEGGVVMWREASAGAAASAGFIIILILTSFRFYPSGTSIWGWAYIIGAAALAIVMVAISVNGFRKYFQLTKK